MLRRRPVGPMVAQVLQSGMLCHRVGRDKGAGARFGAAGHGRGQRAGDGASMFLGEYQHTLDAKGRVSLPRKFRDATGARLVVSKGFEKSLAVYPIEAYERFLGDLMSGGDMISDMRAVRRHFTAGAAETDIDSAGRISLTPALREFAGLSRDVVVAGVGDHIEIWDAKAWATYETEHAKTIEDAAEELARQGIL
jgi:MraZ protein